MSYKNELDNLLWKEITSGNPNEEKIRELVSNGANLNAFEEGEFSDTMFAEVLYYDGLDYDLDLKTHKLLLELGADPNYDGGFQCFFNALLGCRKEVVKLLLDYGANINAISFEDCPIETVLDEAYDDSSYFYWQCEPEKQKLCDEIIEFLITQGAKEYEDCSVKDLKMFLNIVPLYDTGLATYGGKIKITDIAAIPQSLAATFNDWLNRYNSDEVDNKHIEEGKNLAKEIKNYLSKDIRLKYYFARKNARHCEKSISF